ncbi:MAG: carboxyl transferase domain-containing protein, partial [Sulfobacillus sp.]
MGESGAFNKMRELINDLDKRKQRALAFKGQSKEQDRQESKGLDLNARQCLGRLVDEDSFQEFGLLSHSDVVEMKDRSPADGMIGGLARVGGRPVVVVAIDRNVLAGTEGRVHLRKWQHLHEFAIRRGLPIFHMGEGGGLRIPDGMGSDGISQSMMPMHLLQHGRQVPLLTAILG